MTLFAETPEPPARPMIRYHGGKWLIAPWVIKHLPAHQTYVEPYGGAASVLLRKMRSHAEIYNDLDGEVVNMFRVARDHGPKLRRALELTPYSRVEFDLTYLRCKDPVEQARRTILRAYASFGGTVTRATRKDRPMRSGFRCDSNRSGTTPARDWHNYPAKFGAIIERLRGVVIENRPALDVMRTFDGKDTVHYVDPPYVHETRMKGTGTSRSGYRYEMTDEQHIEMADCLHSLKGKVIVSGYSCPLYDRLFPGWRTVEKSFLADGAKPRTETLWIKP